MDSSARLAYLLFAMAPFEVDVPPDVDFRVTVTGRQKQLAQEIQREIYRIGREAW